MKNIKYNKFNERLSEDKTENWRQLQTPEPAQVPDEHQTYLEYPIEFSMQDGEIRGIKVSQREPVWSVNLKKSLISLIKVQLPSNFDIKSNIVRGPTSFPRVWEVMESGLDGKCENTYQTVEIPESELPELVEAKYIDRERCQNRKIFQVVKTRNVNKCSERTAYQVNQPGKTLCPTGNCNNMWQRTSMTRYFACGTSEQDMELEVIVNEAELHQNLRAFNTESLVSGVKQVLKVEEVRSELSSLPQIPSPRTIEGLFYEYPLANGKTSESYRDQQQKLREMPVTSDFLSALSNKEEHTILAKLSPSTLKQRIVKHLEKLSEDLEEVEHFGKKQVSVNVLAVSKIFSLLGTEDMKSLYEQVKQHSANEQQREVMTHLVQEIAVITGTSPAIVFTRHLIESGELNLYRTVMTISMLPHYIRTPTIELINQIFELIKSPVVHQHESTKMNAMLAFSTIVNRACIDRSRFERFPVFVYGEFCTSKNTEITTKYIPYLVEQLKSARSTNERAAAILSLGNLGHESAIQILMPYIEGRDNTTPMEQRLAIYSLHHLGEERRSEVLNIYSSLVFNPTEDRDTRIAAFNQMLTLEPSAVVFQKLATSTWFEKDTEFHKFVYATLKSLSEIEETEQSNTHTPLYKNSHMARQVIHMAKAISTGFSYNFNYFGSEWLKSLEVGYQVHYAHTSSERIQQVYSKIEYFLQQLKFTPLEFCTFWTGNNFAKEVSEVFNSVEKKFSSEWEEIISMLSLKDQTKDETHFQSGIWARLFDDVQIMHFVNTDNFKPIVEKVKKVIESPRDLKKQMCGKTPLNFVKVNNWAPTEVVIPSDMGFPIIIELHMPGVLSVQGELNVECSGVVPSVSLEVTTKGSSALTGYVGTICPFTMDVIATGVEEQFNFNYPVKMTTHYNNGKLNMVFAHNSNTKSSTQEIDMMTYSVKPFSTIKPIVYVDGLPLTGNKYTKTIESEDKRKTLTLPIPYAESLGLDLKLKMETETNAFGLQGLFDYASLYNYNPINAFMFSWTSSAMTQSGRASCRHHEMQFVYNPSRSQTTEVEFDLTFALALKSKTEEPKIVQISNQQQLQIETVQLQHSKPEHQKIQQAFQKLIVEEGFGFNIDVDLAFRGGRSKSYTYSLSAAHGIRQLSQKWNLHLESPHSMDICVDGEFTMPEISLREEQSSKVEVFYKNTIEFGKSCEEHKMEVTGTTGVSRDQSKKSRTSEESIKCEKYTKKFNKLRDELKSLSEGSAEYKKVKEQLLKVHDKKERYCEEKSEQERTLDEVKFEITYTPMPEYVRQYVRYADLIVKGALAPYMTNYKSSQTQRRVEVELNFEKENNAFDMTLTTEEEEIKYKGIRVPEQIRSLVPMFASYTPSEQFMSYVMGSELYPKCRVGAGIVHSFDKKSYHYELDDCYHVLSAETKQGSEYAVLAKEQNGRKELKFFISGSKLTIEPIKQYTESRKEYEIEFDGEKIYLERSGMKVLRTRGQGHYYKLWR